RHYHAGRVGAKALRFATLAADTACGVYAYWEAEELLRIALEHAPGPGERARLEERLGDVYDSVGAYSDAFERYERALEAPDALLGAGASIRLRRKMVIAQRKGGLESAPVLLDRTRSLIGQASDWPDERCRLLVELTRYPDAGAVLDAATEAVTCAEGLDDPLLAAHALEQLAVSLMFARRTREAFPPLERALEIAHDIGDPVRSVRYHAIAGVAHARLGRYGDALREFEAMLQLAEKVGDPNFLGVALNNQGAVLLRLGEFDAAEQALQRARGIHERRDRASLLQSLFNLAERARLAGDLALAVQRFAAMRERASEFDYWTSEAVAEAGIGLCTLEQGDVVAARAAAERALAAADRDGWFEDRDALELLLARLEALDDPAVAVERLLRAGRELESRDIFLWARIELERARLLAGFDRAAAAALVAGVRAATGDVQSPPLAGELQRVHALTTESASD
ncbi:MAG: tetratricopeptide repeat protein, partial [Longimicrobiales bacterium]